MATKSIITRIKNKVDTLAKWQSYTGTLLDGEIAVVRVPTGGTYVNPVTGADEPVVELLMKVGDGTTAFANLPWMSAKASDVYDWAKAATVIFNENNYHLEFRAADNSVIGYADLTDIDARLDALEAKKITVTPNDNTKPGVVQSITQGDDTHEIDVTYGLIKTADIDSKQVTGDKIADSTITTTQLANSAVSTTKIADGAITNAKLGTDISSDKINVGTGTTEGTLSKKLADMDAAISAVDEKAGHGHPYLSNTTKYAASETVGGDAKKATVAGKVEKKLAIQLNGGTATEFDGSADASINITPSAIAAATAQSVTDLSSRVAQNEADITALEGVISKGIMFRGEVASAPSGTTYTLKNTDTAVTAIIGDMVICGEKEYVYVADSSWKELGDLSRVTTLENAHKDIVTAGTYTKVTVAANGHVTAGSNPTTISGYGITDAYTKSDVYTKTETDAALAAKSDTTHTHSIYVNQNAFSTIKVGSTDVAADTATDTVEFTGTNITITGINGSGSTVDTVAFSVADGSTSAKGVVQLNDTVTSTSTTLAATANAVKTAYEKGAQGVADAAAISANYVKITNDNLVTQAGDVIIFDCGGAE